jgi:hypothetical protein
MTSASLSSSMKATALSGVVTDRDLTLRLLAAGKQGDVAVGEVRTRPRRL